eukprot:7356355-Lingulodinium_polyedra.AAC.1
MQEWGHDFLGSPPASQQLHETSGLGNRSAETFVFCCLPPLPVLHKLSWPFSRPQEHPHRPAGLPPCPACTGSPPKLSACPVSLLPCVAWASSAAWPPSSSSS